MAPSATVARVAGSYGGGVTEQARKLLIVEDDSGVLKQLKSCFEDYDVSTAKNREGAIAELRRHEPAVVLQDLHLPPKNDEMEGGLATLADILRLAPHTKVIVLIDNVDQEIALSAGTSSVGTKSSSPSPAAPAAGAPAAAGGASTPSTGESTATPLGAESSASATA